MITSGSMSMARMKASVPIWPTMQAAASISASVSGGIGPMPVTLPARALALSRSRGISAVIVASLNVSFSSRAISRMMAMVCSRCVSPPAVPAVPMISGTFRPSAPVSAIFRSRLVVR